MIHCLVSTSLPKYSTESVSIALCFASCSKGPCWLYVHQQSFQRCVSNCCQHSCVVWSVTQLHCVHSAFDQLRSVREMEYELDFVTNRANRDIQVRWITTDNHFACCCSLALEKSLLDLCLAVTRCTSPCSLEDSVPTLVTTLVSTACFDCLSKNLCFTLQAVKERLAAMTADRDQLRRQLA